MLAGLQYDGEDSHLMCDQDGRLSMSRIIASDVSLKPILSVGATYTYVPRRVFRKFEGLDLIAQGAGNYIQGVAKAEHDVQQLMKIATRIEQEMPFSKIRENLKKSKCLNMEALQGMFQFLRKFGGEPKNLHAARSTAHKIRAEGDTKRRVGQDIWDALGLDYKGHQQLHGLRHAIVGLVYTDPNQKVVCAPDIKKMGDKANMERSMEFEVAIHEMASVLEGLKFDAAISRAQFAFDRACAALNCKAYKAKLLADIVGEFDVEGEKLEVGHLIWIAVSTIMKMDHLSAAVKDALTSKTFSSNVVALTPRTIATSTKTLAGAPARDDLAIMDTVGVRGPDASVAIMKELGWSVGSVVTRRPDKSKAEEPKCRIVVIKGGIVTLHILEPGCTDEGSSKKNSNAKDVDVIEFQSRLWIKAKDVEYVVIPVSAPTACQTTEFQLELIKSVAFVALAEAVSKQEGHDSCQVRMKPKKAVEVVEDIAKGKLVLAPCTTSLQIVDKEKLKPGYDSFNKSSLLLGSFVHESTQYYMFASGYQSFEGNSKKTAKRALFWGVDVTDKESDANVKLDQQISTIKIHSEKITQWMCSQVGTNQVLKIPMMVSTKALKAGDSLVIYQPSKKQRTN